MVDLFESFKDFTEADKPTYKDHDIFKDLNQYVSFYEDFSDSIMSFATMGTRSVINIDTYVYSSIQGTIESIRLVLENGRLGDAFAPLRKYHDSIVLNLYTNLYLKQNLSLENLYVMEVQNWLSGKKKLPHDNYGSMSKHLESSDQLKDIFEMLHKNKNYLETRQRCNDHMHYNYFDNVLINDNKVLHPGRIELLGLFRSDLENLFILHLSCIFYLNDHYMCSSDYLDALEMGMQPPEDSQYWLNPIIQKIFDELLIIKRPDIVELIKSNTCMHLD